MKIRFLQNEKGNTMLVVLGLLVAAIFISFIFFDMFTTFATKRMSQTGADAAALAAANEIKEIYDNRLKTEIEDRMELLREVANELVDEELGIFDGDEEDGDDEDEPSQEDIDRAWRTVLNRMQVPRALRAAVRNEDADYDANIALRYFFNNVWYREWFSDEIEEINEVVCEEIATHRSQWEAAAQFFATENGADEEIETEFRGDVFRVYVRVKKPASFMTVDDSLFGAGERDVYAEAEASIKEPRGIDIRCR